ncbi:MAG: PAS domain S-box protein [Balneolaceae bacterium]|jgi:PAS domain S-box-containing protein
MDQLLFHLNPNPVLIYATGSLHILDANKAFLQKYGFNISELEKLTIKDIRPPEDIKMLQNVLSNLEPEGLNETEVVRHRSKKGEIFYVKVNSHAYTFDDKDARLVVIHDVTDRVNAEKKAQKAFDELHHHVNHSPLAMIKWDAEFRVIEWSKRAEEITGYNKETVVGKTPHLFRFNSKEDLAVVENNMELLISGQRDKANFETEMYRRDGASVNLSIHASVLRDSDGSLISVLTFIEDITEQKKTEMRYQRLFENANDGIFIMDRYKFVECNDEVCNIYGCEKNEILGRTPIDFSPDYQPDGKASKEKAKDKINKALNGEPQVFEWKHKKKDGTPIDVEVSLNRLELGDEVFVQAIVRDLTEQKKAQDQLRKSEQLFRKLFLKAPGAMIMVDKENRVKMVNHSFEELFGYTQEELFNQDLDRVIVAEEEFNSVPRMPGKDFKEGKFYTDVTRYTKEGKKLDLLLGAIPVYLDNEPIAGFGIYVDITEQKEYERKLKQSLEEKQVLLEEIHHRVKNNLAIISGLLQLQSFETEDEQIRNVLNDSQLRIQSMAIIHEMLYQSEDFIDISFEVYVNKLIDTMKNTLPFDHQHIEINIDTAGVSMDINQAIPCAILINELLTNAYKHAFQGKDSGTIWVNMKDSKKQIIIEVKDNGIGLPDDFSIESQTSIGMNLIQTLTQQLGGELKVKNNKGGCFRVCFAKTKRRGSSTLHLVTE